MLREYFIAELVQWLKYLASNQKMSVRFRYSAQGYIQQFYLYIIKYKTLNLNENMDTFMLICKGIIFTDF